MDEAERKPSRAVIDEEILQWVWQRRPLAEQQRVTRKMVMRDARPHSMSRDDGHPGFVATEGG